MNKELPTNFIFNGRCEMLMGLGIGKWKYSDSGDEETSEFKDFKVGSYGITYEMIFSEDPVIYDIVKSIICREYIKKSKEYEITKALVSSELIKKLETSHRIKFII